MQVLQECHSSPYSICYTSRDKERSIADLIKAVNEGRDEIVSMLKAVREAFSTVPGTADTVTAVVDKVETVGRNVDNAEVYGYFQSMHFVAAAGSPTPSRSNNPPLSRRFRATEDVYYADEWVKRCKNFRLGNSLLHLKWGDVMVTFDPTLSNNHQAELAMNRAVPTLKQRKRRHEECTVQAEETKPAMSTISISVLVLSFFLFFKFKKFLILISFPFISSPVDCQLSIF